MKKHVVLAFAICIISAGAAFAQGTKAAVDRESDSLIVESQDTVLLKTYAARYNPRKALLYAAVLPGLGQIYNKKYWKLPLVYGGFIALGYAINFYQDGYINYKAKLFSNLENGYTGDSDIAPGDVYTTSTYRNVVDLYRRQRDFMIVLMGGMYLLQLVDAHVDAHLKEFDLNPQLKVSWYPSVEYNDLVGRTSGVSLVLKF
ncbi:DUF5683 domain-containing protein [Chryseolinea lacunae]|uniref:DUF5683 domain-containing protein n=1 Tax=Chryseolinea lacunae TaxID=2801331 RepID=A0ABS1KVZ5_9BACT|nr:DUF5683 domain-containing protein [Chryseolinea lacunae]MBL0743539.1 hypothetical protein [Chryseolinea lacunae]